IEREEIQVVVNFARVAVVLCVSSNDGVAAGVQHRPGRRRQTDATRIEVVEAGAVVSEDMSEPRQPRFSRARIFLSHVAIEQIRIQPVNLENDDSPCGLLSTICKRTCEKEQSRDANHPVPPEENESAGLLERAASPVALIR